MQETIFDKIISGEFKSWKIWETNKYLAFLTPFANTPGQTVLIPKTNLGAYVFELTKEDLSEFMDAAKQVSQILQKAFDTAKVAMVFEGTGVPYVHAKLYPLIGIQSQTQHGMEKHEEVFFDQYPGYITTTEGPKMDDEKLDEIQKKILAYS